jgi:deoxyribodipyrimidine photolyase
MRSIQEERISQLNDMDVQDGDYVLYWMQEAQRTSYNHALEYAVQRANELEQPLLVVFGWSGSSRRGSTPTWSTATSPRRTTSRT